MKTYFVAGVTALALMAGSAMAQSGPGTMSRSTTVIKSNHPADPDFKSKKTEKVIDAYGNETVKNETYTRDGNATASSSSTQTTTPDGAVTRQTDQQQTTTPLGQTSTTTRTTTT